MSDEKWERALLCYADLIGKEPDWYDRNLERALYRAPFFQEMGLRLYRNADISALRPIGKGTPVQRKATVPYLLCQGRRALVAIQTFRGAEKCDWPHICPRGVMELSFQKGTEERSLTILQQAVEMILSQEGDPRYSYNVTAVDAKLWPCLVREGLVEKNQLPGGQLYWGLSDEGQRQGLCWGWRFRDGTLWEGPLWSAGVREKLMPLQAGTEKRRPFAERLRDLESGRNGQYTVEEFARTDLGTYMSRYPAQLAVLEETLGIGPDTPYHQAAALIWKQMGSSRKELCESGVKLMRLLAAPLLKR